MLRDLKVGLRNLLVAAVICCTLPLITGGAVPFDPGTDNREKISKADQLIKIAQFYREKQRFIDARDLIRQALKELKGKEEQKKLNIELAEIFLRWADKLEDEFNYTKAIELRMKALAIDKVYRLRQSGVDLNNIAILYNSLGQNLKALEYFEKALPILHSCRDHANEAVTLSNIGAIYGGLGKNDKAMEYYERAIPILIKKGKRSSLATALTNMGVLYSKLGRKDEALDYFQQAFQIFKELGNFHGGAVTLSYIGLAYYEISQNQKALEYYGRALQIFQALGNRPREAQTLINISGAYQALGRLEKSVEALTKALRILGAVGDRYSEAVVLNNLGVLSVELGQYRKALQYYGQSLQIRQITSDRSGEATTLINIGAVYSHLDQGQEALRFYKKALPIVKAIKNRRIEAKLFNHIAHAYIMLGRNQDALSHYKMALPISCAVGDRHGEATILANMGRLYDQLNLKKKSLQCYENALLISRTVKHWKGEAVIFSNLMLYWNNLGKKPLAIYCGKSAVNVHQGIRSNISDMNEEIKRSFIREKIDEYRFLVNLLIETGRLSEAQQVLDMLKEEEFFEFTQRDRKTADNLSSRVDFSSFEKSWCNRYNTIMEDLSTSSNEYYVLKFKKNKNKTEIIKMARLESMLKQLQTSYNEFQIQLKKSFDKHEQETKNKPNTSAQAKIADRLRIMLKYLDKSEGGKSAVLHYLVHNGRISTIITSATSQSVKQSRIDENQFNRMIMSYREVTMMLGKVRRGVKIKNAASIIIIKLLREKREIEAKLYNIIFKPVDEELKKHGITNLLISLDGVLRYIPPGALWDGENYLIQRYRMALITPTSMKNITDSPTKVKRILGFGASKGSEGFASLPNVGREIRSIVKDETNGFYGEINGRGFIDDDFTRKTMIAQLKTGEFPLVHIASHFLFSPGDETKNHLLLGDGTTMKLSEIRHMGKLFEDVQLLVLSACQTAVGGNGEEIDGFGELAQQSGAKSVIASLWPVADESTKELMVLFYKNLKDGRYSSKIEALRQAQLELVGLDDLLSKGRKPPRQKTKYASSYFWGAFIMMGNWR